MAKKPESQSSETADNELEAFFLLHGGEQFVADMKLAEATMKRYTQQYAANDGTIASVWRQPGVVEQIVPTERGMQLHCQQGVLDLLLISADCLCVRWLATGDLAEPLSYAISKFEWSLVQFTWRETPRFIELRTSALVCIIQKNSLRIEYQTAVGRPICSELKGIEYRSDGAVRLSLNLRPDEACYGVPERAEGLNLRGKRFTLWNTDHGDYERGSDPLYYNIPFYLGVHSEAVYGVFWDNSHRGIVDLGRSYPSEISFEAEKGELRYYLFVGEDVKSVLARYTELTGRIKLPPYWALGYHQSRYSYYPQEQVIALAEEIRAKRLPCDVIYLDIHYMDGYRVFTWDQNHFPEFAKMIARLHKLGFKVIVILDPGIKVDPTFSVYQEGIARDIFVTYPDGVPVTGVVWPGVCHFPDFTDPDARAWWAEECQKLLDAGVDGIWNDMCEPAVFGHKTVSTLPDFARHEHEGRGSTHLEAHNVYGMLMGRASLEALEQGRPGLRQVNIIRAGYAGAQRYAMSWTGDNAADWDHLKLSIPMTLNMGLAGAPMTGPDIGGFRGDADAELLTRWMQLACLMPYFRNHTALGSRQQEPWAFGQPYEDIMRAAISLRYRLMPYLYSVVAQAYEYGYPVIRPVFMAEPANPELRGIDDCYMLGDSLLVAPVQEPGATKRSLYLPTGLWYDFWTNQAIYGRREITVDAPLERLPLFVKAGTVLPIWPVMQYMRDQIVSTLNLRIYPGKFETVLYEDKGEGLEYLTGDYRWVYLTCAWEDLTLVVKRRTAGRFEPSYRDIKLEVYGFDSEPESVRVDRRPAPLWYYDDGLLELTVDPFSQLEITRQVSSSDRTVARRPW